MNFLEIYENACNTCRVRPNSLLHKTLREAPVRPITHLRLADNYVGPKGFLALVPLIEKCQTLESLDLRGNGLDNKSIISLCSVLRSHLGVHTIDLSRNPISAEGGRHLLQLLEDNNNIHHIVLEQTDLFDAFVERIYIAAAENRGGDGANEENKIPMIIPSRFNNNNKKESLMKDDDHDENSTTASASSASRRQHQQQQQQTSVAGRKTSNAYSENSSTTQHPFNSSTASRQVLGGRSDSVGGIGRQLGGRSGSESPSSFSPAQQQSQHHHYSAGGGEKRSSGNQATLTGTLKPKPPAPAIASEAYSRLTKEQRDLMKERYKQKAAVFSQVEQTASHKLAADFRAEIALLEGAQAKADYSRQGLHYSSSPRRQQQDQNNNNDDEQQQQEDRRNENDTQTKKEEDDDSGLLPTHSSHENTTKLQSTSIDGFFGDHSERDESSSSPSKQQSPTTALDSFPDEKKKKNTTSAQSDADNNNNQSPTSNTKKSVLVSVPMVPISASDLSSNAALTPADQFRALFNQGCSYYNEKNFDAAYCSWNEAVYIATQERNREWLTIVQSNLQNLSFEMLTSEAQEAVDRGDLDDASKSLELALKLATKARNAGWEAEVIKLRRNVLHGSFQSNHDKATSLLEQLVKLEPIDVTDDHRFVSPNGRLEAHTTAFVNEWTMLLIVKELMENCVQSYRCAKGIGGNNGAALEQLVQGTVTTVSKHLIKIYWSATLHDPMSLSWLGAGRFPLDERESLLQLWADLRGTVKELGHSLWFVVELSQYGNLLLASHELTEALDCFEKAAEYAGEINDRFLTGTSLLFCGIVNLQRSSYAKAEALFRSSLTELGEVRFGVAPLRPPKASSAATAGVAEDEPKFVTRDGQQYHQNYTNNNNNNKKNNGNNKDDASLITQPPIEDLCFFHSQSFFMLSRTLIGSYRYRDALEVHERFLLYQHHDVLFEKLQSNFSAMPTTDHLRATSATLNHPLVYYAVHYRFDWNLDKHRYDVSEHIYSWIVVSEGDGKFNSVDVSAELGIPSLLHTIKEARRTLFVDCEPNSQNSTKAQTGVITSLDGVAWKAPLRKLYTALMHQVIDVLSSYAAYSDLGVFTVIPHGFLWLVPYPALLDERDQFLLERITLCHAMCATQVLLSELSVRHLLSNNNTKNMVIRPPPQLVDPSNADDDLISGLTNKKKRRGTANKKKSSRRRKSSNTEDDHTEDEKHDDDDDDDDQDQDHIVDSSSSDNDNNDEHNDDEEENNNNDDTRRKKNQPPATVDQVLRNGITEEQMNEEATQLVRALGSGTLAMSGTSTDVLAQIAFTKVSVLCSSIVSNVSSAMPDKSLAGEMKGGIRVASTFETTGVLSCEEIAFSNLPIETVILPYTALDVDTITRDSTGETVLSLSRGFLGAGTVSVLFSTWQCSDVYPADFLSYFAKNLQGASNTNRAVALAKAVRALIQQEQREAMTIGSTNDDSRPLSCFKPRRWAGIILMGVSEIPHFHGGNNNQQQQQHASSSPVSNFNEYNAFA